jgi:hypothetical protein
LNLRPVQQGPIYVDQVSPTAFNPKMTTNPSLRHVAKLGNKKVNPRPLSPSQATVTANAFLKLPKEIIASLLVPYHRFIVQNFWYPALHLSTLANFVS